MRGHGIAGPDAEFRFNVHGGATLIGCHWPVVNDPERPNKRSRELRVVITREVSDILRGADAEPFERSLRAVLEVMGNRMRHYSAEEPNGHEPFTIHVSLVDLNPR